MNTKFINWILLTVLALIWGSSFILMKRGLEVFSSDEVAALRIFIAFLFLTPLIYRHIKKSHLYKWKTFLAMGMFGNFIPAFLFTKAETGISSSLTGMLNSLTPLFTLIMGVFIFKTKTNLINFVGILIGFAGAIGLLLIGKSEDVFTNFSFGFYVIIATISYALSVSVIKTYLNNINSITATVWALTFIGPLAGIYLFAHTNFVEKISTHPNASISLGYICILAVFGTAISVMLFNLLVKNTTALFASSVTYLIPVVAIFWGITDGEKISVFHFFWIVIILLGVYLVTKKMKKKISLE